MNTAEQLDKAIGSAYKVLETAESHQRLVGDGTVTLSAKQFSTIGTALGEIDSHTAALRAENQRLQQERDEALRIGVTIPDDVLREMIRPPVCGQSQTTVSLGFSPQRMGGCGEEIQDPRKVFRCADCEVPYHQKCLQTHCQSELTSAEATVGELRLREALNKIVAICAPSRNGRHRQLCKIFSQIVDIQAEALQPEQVAAARALLREKGSKP